MRRVTTLSALALVAGCGTGGPNTQPTCERCDTTPEELGTGESVMSCWVVPGEGADEFFIRDELVCEPSAWEAEVAAVTLEANTEEKHLGSVLFETGEEEPTAVTYSRVSYPFEARVNITLGADHPLARKGLAQISTEITIDGPNAIEESAPAVFALPFEAWPVTVYARAQVRESNLSYEIDVSPYVIGSLGQVPPPTETTATIEKWLQPLSFGQFAEETIYVGAASGPLTGTAEIDRESVELQIDGPGDYAATPEGFRRATDADLPSPPAGPALASCWVEPNDGQDAIWCRAEPSELEVETTARAGEGDGATELVLGEEATPVQPVGDGASVTISALVQSSVSGLPATLADEPLEAEFSFESASAPTQELRLPFEVWTVAIQSEGVRLFVDLEPYDLELGSSWGGIFAAAAEELTLAVATDEAKTFFVAAPPEGAELPAHITLLRSDSTVDESDATVSEGSWIAHDGGFEPAP